VLALSTYQLLEAFFAEQPGLLVSFFLATAAFAIRKGRLLLAGTFAALTLIKPQMTLLAILYLLIWSFSDRTRARFWQAFFAVLALLMIASLCIWPNWIQGWFHVLLGYHHYAQPPLILACRNAGSSLPRDSSDNRFARRGRYRSLVWRNRKLRPTPWRSGSRWRSCWP
jgi:Glycosyltransferase family 87